MRRREFILALGGAAAWPLVSRAQQVPVIGFLHSATLDEFRRPFVAAFHRGLAETGYVEGRNVAVEYRWAEDRYDRLPDLAADLVQRRVTVMVTLTVTPAALAAKAATQTIPIVFFLGADPVEYGLVASFAKPGGNMTGFTALTKEVMARRVELLHQIAPTATLFGYLFNPNNRTSETEDVQKAARMLGLHVLMIEAGRNIDIEPAIEKMVRQRAGGLVVSSDGVFFSQYSQIAALAARHAMPSIFHIRQAVTEGGLMSYGPNGLDLLRQVGVYTGRILKGEKPSDLPVQQPTRFDMVLNLKTAKAIGLNVPLTLQASANEVIE